MFCENCGTKMNEGAAFCHNCGAPAHSEKKQDYNQKQSMAAPLSKQPDFTNSQAASSNPQVASGNPQAASSNPQAASGNPQAASSNPQAAAVQPQTAYRQNTYQQGYYQQPSQFGNIESVISSSRTLGILSIVGAFTITLGGLICGIIGLLKINDLKVPSQLAAQRDSAKRLNTIGIAISAGLMILAIIIISIASCSDSYY